MSPNGSVIPCMQCLLHMSGGKLQIIGFHDNMIKLVAKLRSNNGRPQCCFLYWLYLLYCLNFNWLLCCIIYHTNLSTLLAEEPWHFTILFFFEFFHLHNFICCSFLLILKYIEQRENVQKLNILINLLKWILAMKINSDKNTNPKTQLELNLPMKMISLHELNVSLWSQCCAINMMILVSYNNEMSNIWLNILWQWKIGLLYSCFHFVFILYFCISEFTLIPYWTIVYIYLNS